MHELYPKTKKPPFPYLKQVCNHCCKASALYIDLWEISNPDNQLFVEFNDIANTFGTAKQAFNHNLRLLMREGLINFENTPKGINIELTDWDYDENPITP